MGEGVDLYFGILMASAMGFKARMDILTCMLPEMHKTHPSVQHLVTSKVVFTLDVCVNVTVKFNIVSMENVKNGFRPILCVCVCVSIDAMLNFDGDVDANANVKCEHSLR